MREKILDASNEEKHVRRMFYHQKSEYFKNVNKNSIIDKMFHRMMKYEVEGIWYQGKMKNQRKIPKSVR